MVREGGRVTCGNGFEKHGGEGMNEVADGQANCDKSNGNPDERSGGRDGVTQMLVTGKIIGVKGEMVREAE